MRRSLKALQILVPALVLSACQPQAHLEVIRWQKGQKKSQISPLENIEKSSAQSVVSAQEQVAFQDQKVGPAVVENSFIKTLSTLDGEDLLIEAAVSFDQNKLEKLELAAFEKAKPTIVKKLKERVPAFREFEINKVDIIISKNHGFHEPLWKISYFDKKGVPWALKMNNHFQVRSIERVGSQFHDTFAIIYPKGPKLSALSEVLLKSIQAQPALSSPRVTVTSQAPAKVESVLEPLRFHPQDTRFDQVQAFYFLDESIKWMESTLGVKLNKVVEAVVHVGAPDKTNTAFYYDSKIRLGTGDDITYSKIPQDPSIVIHESIHALVEAVARLPYEGEGGSLNEAYADFFTALQTGSPHMGEAAYLKGPFRRTVNNNYKLADKRGTLYFDSGIISGLLWELKEKLGTDVSREIALLTLNRLTPVSDFNDFNTQLREVLKTKLSEKQLETAMEVLKERGF
ncbi:MAG: hypothetical protein ACLGGX_02490 [Bdellovibrionia bacterium]